MKSSQVKNCFDDVLRMLQRQEEVEAATQHKRDAMAEGLQHWKERATVAEEKLQLLGTEGASKAEVVAERNMLREKLNTLQQERAIFVEAILTGHAT